MTREERAEYIREQHEAITRGANLAAMVETEGWKEVQGFLKTWIFSKRQDLSKVSTEEPAAAIDAIRRYQLTEELVSHINGYVDDSIHRAKEITGSRTLEEALLMEQMKHEHTEPEPGSASNSTGY